VRNISEPVLLISVVDCKHPGDTPSLRLTHCAPLPIFAAQEDLAAQLRVARRRLQEAEEEQYRAEEDTAALRAEVARLEALSHGHVRRPSQEISQAENELDKARAELQVRGVVSSACAHSVCVFAVSCQRSLRTSFPVPQQVLLTKAH
jgi:multidrug efflux pump subunit AcrA (membrane-fusion protein)